MSDGQQLGLCAFCEQMVTDKSPGHRTLDQRVYSGSPAWTPGTSLCTRGGKTLVVHGICHLPANVARELNEHNEALVRSGT